MKKLTILILVVLFNQFIGTGVDEDGNYLKDFYEYNPETDKWNQKTSVRGQKRREAAAFVINGKGYVITGENNGVYINDFWEYDPVADLWEEKTSFEGSGKIEAIAFTIGNRGFVTTGRSSSYYFDDIWGFDPDIEYNEYD